MISQSGKAIDLTRDHKPHVPTERQRILSNGGFVCTDGRLNGELGVARAIGDYHIPDLKQPDAGGVGGWAGMGCWTPGVAAWQ